MSEERNVWFGRMTGKSGKSDAFIWSCEEIMEVEDALRSSVNYDLSAAPIEKISFPITFMDETTLLRNCNHRFGRLHQTGEPGRCWMLCHKCGGAVFGPEERLKEEKRAWQK